MGAAGARSQGHAQEEMTRPVGPPRVVIDTNLVLSALVFAQGRLTPLRQAWQAHRIQPLVSRVTAAELIRVLAYPKFRLAPEERRELLADYLPYCKTVRIPEPPPKTPACRDPFDVPFLQLALAGKARALVTGDRDLLSLARGFACPILSADRFIDSLG
jgi:putative PIN family toxin of toxin-antitoxin system